MSRGVVCATFAAIIGVVSVAANLTAQQPPSPPNARSERTYLVQLQGPVLEEWKTELIASGAELLEYVPHFAFRVRMSPDAAARVQRLSFVTSARADQREARFARRLLRNGRRPYVVRLDPGDDVAAIESILTAAGAQVLRRGRSALFVVANGQQVDALADLDGVASIENFALRIKHNEYGGGVIVGGNVANANGFDGSSQTIAIADTGLGNGSAEGAHAGIAPSRVLSIFNWPGVPDFCFESIVNDGALDVDSGHGTHVATTALGAGNASGVGRGTAPSAGLVFQSIENYAVPSILCNIIYGIPEAYYLVGIPDDVGDLFQQAYSAGARIHSNSWGAAVSGEYTADAANTDAFVWSHRDMAIAFSAGNSGTDLDADGVVDEGSINSPGSAKNVITVGASENDRQAHWECDASLSYTTCAAQGGQNQIFTYGGSWPDRFPVNPLRDDVSAGNAEQLAGFSSRGPTIDGRIKPDVVAPGTWMLSGYSDRFQQQYDGAPNPQNGLFQYDGWGFPLDASYKYMGGTSMSAPLVAGGAAVVRDAYLKVRGHHASAALVKATLINSAIDLLDENNDGVFDNANPIPNVHEGWGRIDLGRATSGDQQIDDETAPLVTGTSAAFSFPVTDTGAAFKATIAWTDYPSNPTALVNLVNDLDLIVTAPDGTTYRGNVFAGGWSVAGGAPDRINNVENVYVFAAAAGTWTVTVSGYNVPNGPQPFALVVDATSGAGSTVSAVRLTADDATATEAGATSGSIRFTRSGNATSALTVNFEVGGTATAGSDYAALGGSVTIPEGATDVVLAIEALDDASYEAPESVVVSLAASADYVPGSPSSATVTITSDDLPADLVVTAVAAPAQAAAGAAVTITDTTRNQGTGSASPSETGFYLSLNSALDAADVFLSSRAVGTLGAGASEPATGTFTIPAATLPGRYYVIAKADGAGAIGESSETNNVRTSGSMRVGPDLTVSALVAPSTAAAGDAVLIADTTKNLGAAESPASTTTFYLSTNTTFDAGDVQLGTRAVIALGPGLAEVQATSLTVPETTLVGSYYVLAQADGPSAVAEHTETNNVKASGLLRIGADLTVSALTGPASAGAGDTIEVVETTKNAGAGDSPASTTVFYLSLNGAVEPTDTVLASRPVPALDSTLSHTATVQVTIPAGTTADRYYVLAKADGLNEVSETNDGNNVRSLTVEVGPDLSVQSVTAPAVGAPGGTLTVNEVTRNEGGGHASQSETAFYLSSNSTWDVADTLLETRDIPSLGPGATNTGSITLTIPSSAAVGNYFVIAKADRSGAVTEVLETNNTKSSLTVRIGPDLTVSAVNAPAIVVRGATITVTDTTRNDGGSNAGPTTTSYYLSANSGWDATDLLLGSRPVGMLLPGVSANGQASVVVPASLAPGNYYVIARSDATMVVVETSEANNVRTKALKVNP